MTPPRYVVGIDLGTTHCAIAAVELERPKLHVLKVPQLVGVGEVSERDLLPSFLYLPSRGEMSEPERSLPWGPAEHVVGEFARKRGAAAPGRLVASAKSWVCHGGVNRRAAILPWGADEDAQISPYAAQVAYLSHLKHTWNAKHADAPLAEQDVVVTVPASFDEGARTLTSDAAAEAGLGQVRLLEEPQAAFYDYLGTHSDDARAAALKEKLASAKLVLVVDIGGGTTDLTLLRVLSDSQTDANGVPRIERIAVGGHLMLGGDNMDAALALFALNKAGIARPDDATLWSGVVQSARVAKERLLAADAPEETVISYQGRGSRLVGRTKSIVLRRDEALKVLLDGCFPMTAPSDTAKRTARAGLTTLGLPFASDTAVPRHVCTFLRRHVDAAIAAGASVHEGLPRPDLLLLNGGVFNASATIERLQQVLASWYNGRAIPLLEHTSLETSVACGAVRAGLARYGKGALIAGGTPKAYYIGLEHAGRARALCVAPRNADEGSRFSVSERLFELRLNEPVSFPLFAYTGDRVDTPGRLIDVDATELESLAPLQTLLRGKSDTRVRETQLSVTIESSIDEIGGLRLGLVSAELPPRRWTLEFVMRQMQPELEVDKPAPSSESREPPHANAAQASRLIEQAFRSEEAVAVKSLRRDLEGLLGGRGEWSAATCRVLADVLLQQELQRSVSQAHDLNWIRLCGWTLRPGFGTAGDAGRLDALWELMSFGPKVPNKLNWAEWWILWRRIAAGLDAQRQQLLFEGIRPWLWPKGKPPVGPKPEGVVEMMRLLAALERLPVDAKIAAGKLFLERVKKIGSYWALGRVGARVPFDHKSSHVVPARVAEEWLEALLALDWAAAAGADFAAASIARLTGDAGRDVAEPLRTRVSERLTESGANASWIDMVLRTTALVAGDVKHVLGDKLPSGLRLPS